MHFRGDKPLFFATDLTNFLGCRHLTAVERLAAHGLAKRPYYDDPMLEILRERGLEHEQAYVRRLRATGKRVVEIDKQSHDAFGDTMRAMQEGVDVIVQARLEHGSWAGWADVLLRVEGEGQAGAQRRYEPVETKLAKETRGATIIQLCLYADLLAEIQGAPPAFLRVVVPDSRFEPECYRFDEFRAYFRLIRRKFEAELQLPLATSVATATPYPDPVPHCDVCNWYSVCNTRRVGDDHISLVAGIQKAQRKELAAWGVRPRRRGPVRGPLGTFCEARCSSTSMPLSARASWRVSTAIR